MMVNVKSDCSCSTAHINMLEALELKLVIVSDWYNAVVFPYRKTTKEKYKKKYICHSSSKERQVPCIVYSIKA